MLFFSNLQCLVNLILKFRVTQYFKNVIRTIIIENNWVSSKKQLLTKKRVFTVKTQPGGWNGYIPGYIPRPTLIPTHNKVWPCTRGQHFIAILLGEQVTITANHHHEGAPLTVTLMSGKKHFGAHVLLASLNCRSRTAICIENCFFSESNWDQLAILDYFYLQIIKKGYFHIVDKL